MLLIASEDTYMITDFIQWPAYSFLNECNFTDDQCYFTDCQWKSLLILFSETFITDANFWNLHIYFLIRFINYFNMDWNFTWNHPLIWIEWYLPKYWNEIWLSSWISTYWWKGDICNKHANQSMKGISKIYRICSFTSCMFNGLIRIVDRPLLCLNSVNVYDQCELLNWRA